MIEIDYDGKRIKVKYSRNGGRIKLFEVKQRTYKDRIFGRNKPCEIPLTPEVLTAINKSLKIHIESVLWNSQQARRGL